MENYSSYLLRYICFIILNICISASLFCQTDTIKWTGLTGDKLWTTATNWDSNTLPSVNDHVEIDSLEVIIPAGNTIQIQSLDFRGDAFLLRQNSTLQLKNSLENGLYANADFTNNGTINISNTAENGIELRNFDHTKFVNNGAINILDNIAQSAIFCFNLTTMDPSGLINNGTINITQNTFQGIRSGKYINTGTINVFGEEFTKGIILENESDEFINEACATINLTTGLDLSDGSFVNNGFIVSEGGFGGIIFSNVFINNGFIQDLKNHISGFENNSVESMKLLQQIYVGQEIPIINEGDSPPNYTSTAVFLHENLTGFAGTYNSSTLSWTPNSNAVGDSVFYINFTDVTNNCELTMKFITTFPISEINRWTGGINSWNIASNWSLNRVPLSTDSVGIFNESDQVFITNNSMAIANSIILFGKLRVTNNATLTMDGSEDGIKILDGELTNNGILTISNMDRAINHSGGDFINNGQLYLTDNNTGFLTFTNISNSIAENSGSIIIEKSNLGINGTHFTNNQSGIITISIESSSQVGIGSSDFINDGIITVEGNNRSGTGIFAKLINNSSGVVNVRDLDHGIISDGTNNGILTADDCINGMEAQGSTFTNETTGICIVDSCNIGFTMKNNFTNKEDGQVQIKNCTTTGILCEPSSSATFMNDGTILVDSIGGIGIQIEHEFINNATGTIDVTNVQDAIILEDYFIDNFGTIGILHASSGITTKGEYFNNKMGAALHIDWISGDAIIVEDQSSSSGILLNVSEITIGENVAGANINQSGSSIITNFDCEAVIYLNGPLTMTGTSTFNNHGIIIQEGSHVNSLTNIFFNRGLLIDPNENFENLNINNIGYYSPSVTGNFTVNDLITDPLVGTNSQFVFIDQEWFTDSDLSELAGIYDDVNNTFMPNNNAVGLDTFYYEVSRTNNCSNMDTVFIIFENPISPTCGTKSWMGGSGSWNNAANWIDNVLPSSCDIVEITGAMDSVLITSNSNITIKQLNINGYLQLNNNGQLNITDSTSNGITLQGKLVNQGTLNIIDPTNYGIRLLNGSSLINQDEIIIHNAGLEALSMKTASLLNSGAILLE